MSSLIGAFTYKRKLTLTTTSGGANITGSLTDFPICVHINSASWTTAGDRTSFFGAHNAAGKRVQFFASDQTTNLAYEVDRYDSANEVATYWVKVPTVTGNSTTEVWVAYGNDPNSADQDQGTSVWDSGFVAVWHLQTLNGGTPFFNDSTANALGVTNHGGTTEVTDAPINSGRHGDGVDDSCYRDSTSTPWVAGVNGDPVTLSCWCTTDETSDHHTIIGVGDNGGSTIARRAIYIYSGVYGVEMYNTFRASTTARTTAWKHVAAVIPTPSGQHVHDVDFYTDGVATDTDTGSYDNDANLTYLGSGTSQQSMSVLHAPFSSAIHRWHGQVDEARFSKVARSADWIKGEYWSMKKTSWPGDGWITWSATESSATSFVQGIMEHKYIPPFLGR